LAILSLSTFPFRVLCLNAFLASVTLVGIDEETAKIFGRERGRLRAAGMIIGDIDLLIGTTALQHNLTLLTNNRRHFERIDGLRIEKENRHSARFSCTSPRAYSFFV
jgi:predicted nucleic acid-binding protein